MSTDNNSEQSLEKLIPKAPFVQSMMMESRIRREFNALGWHARQSFFYQDIDTQKKRELDVYATKCFHRNGLTVFINLIIEAKSKQNANFVALNCNNSSLNTLLATNINRPLSNQLSSYSNNSAERSFIEYLSEKIDSIRSQNHDSYYNFNVLESDLGLPIPPCEHVSSIFNVGHVKEEEKDKSHRSYWSGYLGLMDAAKGISSNFTNTYENILIRHINEISDALKDNHSKPHNSRDYFFNIASVLCVYYPILVVDSPIFWIDENDLPTRIPYMRFSPGSLFYDTHSWCDIVDLRHISTYSNKIQTHIENHFNSHQFQELYELENFSTKTNARDIQSYISHALNSVLSK